MPILQTTYGLKPAQILRGGSAGSLPVGSYPFMGAGGGVRMTGDTGRTVSYAKLYRTQPWIAVGVKRLTEHVARLPLHLYRYLDSEHETRRRERQHAAATLLSNPRPGRTGFHLRWEIALSLYVHGNYVGWRRRPGAGEPPAEVWGLDWRQLEPIRLGDSGPIIAWRWRGTGIPGLERDELIYPDDALHIAFEGADGPVGISPLEQLGVTVRGEDAAQRHSEAAFRNGTRFGAAAILDPKVKADQIVRDGVRDELAATHGGVDNAFKFAVLGGGITDLKPIGGQSAVEAELIAQRKVNREEIAAVIGIPAPLAGILDEAKYSSMKEFHRLLYVTALGGPLSLVSESLQAQLIGGEPAWRDDPIFAEFSLDAVLKGDVKERMDAYGTAIDHGILTLNDVRRREGEAPYTDERANEPLIAANNVRPLSAIGDEGDTTDDVATSILSLVGKSATDALATAADLLDAGDTLDAWDVARFKSELGGALSDYGLNGTAGALVDAVADSLDHDLKDVTSADDVRAIAHRYAVGGMR